MNKVKEYFDQIAPQYVHEDNERIDELLKSLNLKKNSRILDLGAGRGIISNKLQVLYDSDVVALDLSEKMIEYAKLNTNNPRVNFINDDYYEFEAEPFDAIVCFDAYPHFLDVGQFVSKSGLLIRKNGILAIIHDCPREELNTHHKQHAMGVSRQLKPLEEEVKPFLELFEIVSLLENDKIIKMILRRK